MSTCSINASTNDKYHINKKTKTKSCEKNGKSIIIHVNRMTKDRTENRVRFLCVSMCVFTVKAKKINITSVDASLKFK